MVSLRDCIDGRNEVTAALGEELNIEFNEMDQGILYREGLEDAIARVSLNRSIPGNQYLLFAKDNITDVVGRQHLLFLNADGQLEEEVNPAVPLPGAQLDHPNAVLINQVFTTIVGLVRDRVEQDLLANLEAQEELGQEQQQGPDAQVNDAQAEPVQQQPQGHAH